MSALKVAFLGGINTDIVALGLAHFPTPNKEVLGSEFQIAAGGKARNAAEMTAHLIETGRVAMLGVTIQDKLELYQVPLEALKAINVSTEFVRLYPPTAAHPWPGIAIVSVDQAGDNTIILFPGPSELLTLDDVASWQPVFDQLAAASGYLCIGTVSPTAKLAAAKMAAATAGVKVLLDPSQIEVGQDVSSLIDDQLWLIKPNQHEAEILTGIQVHDPDSAAAAATALQDRGVANVLITLGEGGAFLAMPSESAHIPAPQLKLDHHNSVGCGDQVMAALVAGLADGLSLPAAVHRAVIAGTLQFGKAGVVAVTKSELLSNYQPL